MHLISYSQLPITRGFWTAGSAWKLSRRTGPGTEGVVEEIKVNRKNTKMKKLLIAAAVAAMGAVYADCDISETPVTNCAEVYDVVMNLKTTTCKCANIKTVINGNDCGINKPTTETKCEAWRQVVAVKVQGVIFSCTCDCTDDVTGSILDANVLAPAIWNLSVGDDMSGNQFFWLPASKVVLPDSDLLSIKWLARIGKTKTQVEAAGTFGDGINVAGYGTYDVRAKHVKAISGNAAGVWGGPIDCSDEEGQNICPAYELCDATAAIEDPVKTFASGTWSVKYNAAKSKAIMSNRANLWGKVVPKAVASYSVATWYGSVSL